jgi:hypothetical protein
VRPLLNSLPRSSYHSKVQTSSLVFSNNFDGKRLCHLQDHFFPNNMVFRLLPLLDPYNVPYDLFYGTNHVIGWQVKPARRPDFMGSTLIITMLRESADTTSAGKIGFLFQICLYWLPLIFQWNILVAVIIYRRFPLDLDPFTLHRHPHGTVHTCTGGH